MTMLQIRSMRGLGSGATVVDEVSAAVPQVQFNATSPALLQRMATSQVTNIMRGTGLAPGVPNVPPSPDASTDKCACLVTALLEGAAAQGVVLPSEAAAQFALACAVDPAALEAAAVEARVNIEGCKPWYKRKVTWIVGGALLVGGGAYIALR